MVFRDFYIIFADLSVLYITVPFLPPPAAYPMRFPLVHRAPPEVKKTFLHFQEVFYVTAAVGIN